MRCLMLVAACLALAGCSLGSSMIRSEATSFNEIIEDATNRLLVLNVLRARDKAPLHFADIPTIRESLQANASFSTLQFLGSSKPTSTTDSSGTGISMQIAPSFEVTHLDSKEFNTGISSPIDIKIVKYWLDRGLDRRIVLLLFFSAAEIVERQPDGQVRLIRIMNSPRDAVDIIRRTSGRRVALRSHDPAAALALRCDTQSDFERYLKLVNVFDKFFANAYKERRLVARDLRADAEGGKVLQIYAGMDPNKVEIVPSANGMAYSVYTLSPEQKIALCFHSLGAPTTRKSCYQKVVDVAGETPAAHPPEYSIPFRALGDPQLKPSDKPSEYCAVYNQFLDRAQHMNPGPEELRLHGRSVGEMFQFLGDLLQYQEDIVQLKEANAQLGLKLNSPVTFGYCERPEEKDADPGCDDIFLRLDGESCNARFTVSYRRREYTVANFTPNANCSTGPLAENAKDHTLEILSVLHQLVGINKSASDIRSTPFVQVLP